MVSALGASKNANIFYSKIKGEMEASLIALNYPSLIIVRPSFILGKRKEARWGERIFGFLFKIISPVLIGPLKKIIPVEAKAIAETMLDAAQFRQLGIRIISSEEIKK